MIPVRGRIYRADLGFGLKPFLIVSNYNRNRNLQDALAVRLTTSAKPVIPTVIEMTSADPMQGGRILCDDIVAIYRDELKEDLGALSRATMTAVDAGLKAALSLT